MIFQGLFIDGFAGGGGASTGIAQAIGREVDIAVNHSPTAIAIHRANHPGTTHYCQDIRAVWPKAVTRMEPVAGAWFSPDCKEFSKAKGGPVKDRSIRSLADEVVVWLRDVQPTVAYLENVEEFSYAAPLDEENRPIKGREGEAFRRHLRQWRGAGYRVQHRVLRACDYGAPTSRKRLYIVMRRDGLPIVWPKPTHGPPGSPGVRSGRQLPYRTAAECIDWSIPCPSIFDRKRPLKDATLRRIAHGVMRYVVNAAEPFIVRAAHGDDGRHRTHPLSDPLGAQPASNEFALADVSLAPHINTNRNSGKPFTAADEPAHTVTAGGAHLNLIGATLVGVGGRRGQSPPMPMTASYPTTTVKADAGVAAAAMVRLQHGERRPGERPREQDLRDPAATIAAGGGNHAAVTAFLSTFYSNGGKHDARNPMPTVTAGSNHHAVVAAHIEQASTGGMLGRPASAPLTTITTSGSQQRIVETALIEADALPPEMMARAVTVAAFLVKYYGAESSGHGLAEPIHTVTVKDRFAVVTVTIDATTYVIVDIGLRMLKPRELARAQGFPDDYVLDPIVPKVKRGKLVHEPLTIAEQISAIGNSVCPPVARALVAANQPGIHQPQEIAA